VVKVPLPLPLPPIDNDNVLSKRKTRKYDSGGINERIQRTKEEIKEIKEESKDYTA